MSQQPEQNKTARQVYVDFFGVAPNAQFLQVMESYASQQTASLQKQVELLQIRDEKREARESNLHKENGGLHAQIESLQKQLEELRLTVEGLKCQLRDSENRYNQSIERNIDKRERITQLEEALKEAKPYVESPYECIFSNDDHNEYVKDLVEKALNPQDNQKEK